MYRRFSSLPTSSLTASFRTASFRTALILSALFFAVGCSRPPKVKSVKAARTTVESTVSSVNSGTVHAEQVAELAFGAVGRVKKLTVKLGDMVKKDTLLAELENDDLIAAHETAQAEAKRRKEMYANKLMAQAQIDDVRRMVDSARVAYEKSQIRAPYDGMIGELNLEIGQLSQITTVIPKALIRIIDLNPRYILATIDEADLSKIHVDLPARVKILAVRREPFLATVRKVVPFVNSAREQDRTAEIELTVDSGGILLPAGGSADVEIIVETRKDVLSAPTRAILGRGAGRFVFLVDGGKVRKQPVTVGLYNYDRSEVLSGLSANDIIAIPSDAVDLTDGMKVETETQPWP